MQKKSQKNDPDRCKPQKCGEHLEEKEKIKKEPKKDICDTKKTPDKNKKSKIVCKACPESKKKDESKDCSKKQDTKTCEKTTMIDSIEKKEKQKKPE